LSKPITSIDEMHSKQNLDENSGTMMTDLSQMGSRLIENKNILGKFLKLLIKRTTFFL
jgi:hypothetical protein